MFCYREADAKRQQRALERLETYICDCLKLIETEYEQCKQRDDKKPVYITDPMLDSFLACVGYPVHMNDALGASSGRRVSFYIFSTTQPTLDNIGQGENAIYVDPLEGTLTLDLSWQYERFQTYSVTKTQISKFMTVLLERWRTMLAAETLCRVSQSNFD